MLAAHLNEDPEPLPDVSGVPAAVTELNRRCLAKDPAARPSAGQVAAVLASACDLVRGEP
jgi:serine/threonine-protein kinase